MLQDVFESEEFTAAPLLTPQQESHYLQAYLPLVRKVVRQLAPQCNCIIDRQDMEQTALMGLLNAIRRYGLPDEGFAGYAVHRIRGAILDELRALDWRPRQLRQTILFDKRPARLFRQVENVVLLVEHFHLKEVCLPIGNHFFAACFKLIADEFQEHEA